jgi:hypothetical protein
MTRVELNRTQSIVAQRMTHSRAAIPDFTLRLTVDMEEIIKLRRSLADREPSIPTINDFVVRAAAIRGSATPFSDQISLRQFLATGVGFAERPRKPQSAKGGRIRLSSRQVESQKSLQTLTSRNRRRTSWCDRQAGGHWFEPSTAHPHESPASRGFFVWPTALRLPSIVERGKKSEKREATTGDALGRAARAH